MLMPMWFPPRLSWNLPTQLGPGPERAPLHSGWAGGVPSTALTQRPDARSSVVPVRVTPWGRYFCDYCDPILPGQPPQHTQEAPEWAAAPPRPRSSEYDMFEVSVAGLAAQREPWSQVAPDHPWEAPWPATILAWALRRARERGRLLALGQMGPLEGQWQVSSPYSP